MVSETDKMNVGKEISSGNIDRWDDVAFWDKLSGLKRRSHYEIELVLEGCESSLLYDISLIAMFQDSFWQIMDKQQVLQLDVTIGQVQVEKHQMQLRLED